jgi:hypothetical protein
MQQLTWTSCQPGRSVTGASGFQVRAASRGLTPERLDQASRHVSYRLPPGIPPETTACSAPVRLALLQAPDLGRFLVHSVSGEADAATGRLGNYFSHLVLDLSERMLAGDNQPALDLATVLRSWRGPFWQTKDDPAASAVLPVVEPADLLPGSSIHDEALVFFLQRPAGRDLFRFLLSAFLMASPSQRIYLAAGDDDVALALYGLVRCLPASLTRGLTFSTYERDPIGCPARIVATRWSNERGFDNEDLPSGCYETGFALNVWSGRSSTPPREPAFVEAVLQHLTGGDLIGLDAFRAAWERLGLTATDQLDLAWRITHEGPELSPERVQQALERPELAALLVEQNGTAHRLVERALDDAPFRKTYLARLAAALRTRPMELRSQAEEIHQQGVRALSEGNLARARICLEELLPALTPERAERVWGELFTALETPEQLPADVRLFLLPRVLPRDVHAGRGSRAANWLAVSPERLEEVLALPLAPAYKLLAVESCLVRQREAPLPLVKALGARPELLLELLPRLQDERRARDLFNAALGEMKPGKLADELLRRPDQWSPGLLDHCLETLFQKGEGGPEWARKSWRTLVKVLPAGRCVAVLASQVIEGMGPDPTGALLDFLVAVEKSEAIHHLEPDEQAKLRDLVGVEAYLRKPALDETTLTGLAETLRRLPAGPTADQSRQRVRQAVVDLLWKLPMDPLIALERVLAVLGPVLAGKPGELYRQLIAGYRQRRDLCENKLLIHALASIGFGNSDRAELAGQIDPGDASTLVRQLDQKKGAEVRRYLETRVQSWKPEARERWQQATTAAQARPVPPRRSLRPLLYFLMIPAALVAGLLLGLVVSLLWKV